MFHGQGRFFQKEPLAAGGKKGKTFLLRRYFGNTAFDRTMLV
jgi:hypothetical protein